MPIEGATSIAGYGEESDVVRLGAVHERIRVHAHPPTPNVLAKKPPGFRMFGESVRDALRFVEKSEREFGPPWSR
jgi:hypothetical protein